MKTKTRQLVSGRRPGSWSRAEDQAVGLEQKARQLVSKRGGGRDKVEPPDNVIPRNKKDRPQRKSADLSFVVS
ncbi:hypothetical protein A8709_01655 [Paenibacillus pectinilyticus]|uniref:Uncharacterized protein n=1 Tax=Paenibacillus pectinilyticus TaxID=512399 RepID=A0A1C1A6J8_9BACL|nr:hypothetical protein A8709_01655 [Paenibacillus pectinilyticus]